MKIKPHMIFITNTLGYFQSIASENKAGLPTV